MRRRCGCGARFEAFLKDTALESEPVVLRPARPVKLAADPHRQLAELRQESAAAVAELEDVRRRPLPLEEALNVLDRSIEPTAFRFRDFAGGLCAPEGETRELSLGAPTWGDRGAGAVDFSPAVAFGDKLREFYAQRITEFLAANPPGLPRAAQGEGRRLGRATPRACHPG